MSTIIPPPERIILFRHAQAAWPEPTMRDYERRLSERGVDDATSITKQMKDKEIVPDIILSSSAIRCRQTSDIAYRGLGRGPSCHYNDDLYQAAPITYIEAIGDCSDHNTVMIVGHNPGIEELLLILIGDEAFNKACPYGYPTAGVAILDYIGNHASKHGTLHWSLSAFLTP